MKYYIALILFFATLYFYSCKPRQLPLLLADKVWLDSIKNTSDSTYTKRYRNNRFVTAEYFINKNKKSVCQLMKDSFGTVRQIIITKNNTRTFFAAYYPNGQLMASYSMDSFGLYHGPSKYYYENGQIKSEGDYAKGFSSGQWKNYNEKGNLSSIDEYDLNGQRIKSVIKK